MYGFITNCPASSTWHTLTPHKKLNKYILLTKWTYIFFVFNWTNVIIKKLKDTIVGYKNSWSMKYWLMYALLLRNPKCHFSRKSQGANKTKVLLLFAQPVYDTLWHLVKSYINTHFNAIGHSRLLLQID